MREVEFSDDPARVWLSPERYRAAIALLELTHDEVARRAVQATKWPIRAADLAAFAEHGAALDIREVAAVKAVLLPLVEFPTDEGEVGALLKRHVSAAKGSGYVQFGGLPRPPLRGADAGSRRRRAVARLARRTAATLTNWGRHVG